MIEFAIWRYTGTSHSLSISMIVRQGSMRTTCFVKKERQDSPKLISFLLGAWEALSW
jgi:hypothetical protein